MQGLVAILPTKKQVWPVCSGSAKSHSLGWQFLSFSIGVPSSIGHINTRLLTSLESCVAAIWLFANSSPRKPTQACPILVSYSNKWTSQYQTMGLLCTWWRWCLVCKPERKQRLCFLLYCRTCGLLETFSAKKNSVWKISDCTWQSGGDMSPPSHTKLGLWIVSNLISTSNPKPSLLLDTNCKPLYHFLVYVVPPFYY